jgi:hypothetical protein
VDQSEQVDGLEALRACGAIVIDQWQRADRDALILCVAAADVDLVRAELVPQLPRRLSVVRSRYTAEDVHRARAAFHDHARDWHFDHWHPATMDADGQPCARAGLMYVSEDLGAWAATMPAGLLVLHPAIRPA